jgi:cytochrome P450
MDEDQPIRPIPPEPGDGPRGRAPHTPGVDRIGPAIAGLAGVLRGVSSDPGVRQAVIRAVLGSTRTFRDACAVLRLARPRLTLPLNLVRAYEAEGTLMLTRAADVAEVIRREADFEVVYGPRMRALTGGRDFFLGLQDGPDYQRDRSAVDALVQPGDLDRVLAMARAEASAAVTGAEGALDIVPALTARIPAIMARDWFGIAVPLEQLIADSTILFFYLFSDLTAEPRVEAGALAAAERTRAAIRASMDAAGPETLLGRAVAAGKAGNAVFDEEGVVASILGLFIGAIPTLSKTACLAVEELLRWPDQLSACREAAQAGDEDGVATYLWEALRFNPMTPFLYRRTPAATRIGDEEVPAGRMVLAVVLSAMHDGAAVPQPEAFRPGRPWEAYRLWGEGLHRCWGDRVNSAILPAMLTPLLARDGLRQEAPPDGGGTPFFRSYRLSWRG